MPHPLLRKLVGAPTLDLSNDANAFLCGDKVYLVYDEIVFMNEDGQTVVSFRRKGEEVHRLVGSVLVAGDTLHVGGLFGGVEVTVCS